MSTITNTSLSQFYALKDAKQGTTGNAAQQSAAPSLAAALSALTGAKADNAQNNATGSYLLDLSEEAKNYLQRLNGSSTATSGASARSGIVLTSAQQKTLTDILAAYKDAPYNDATFTLIQQDLDAAGIGADTLAAKNQVKQLNTTLIFLDVLNGGDGSAGTIGDSETLKSQAKGYLEAVVKQWESISSTVNKRDNSANTSR